MKKRAPSRVKLLGGTYGDLVIRVAANTRRLREAQGLTQDDCAARCHDLGPAALRSVEAGRSNLTLATLARLCDGLAVDVAELFAPTPVAVLPKRRPGRPRRKPETDRAARPPKRRRTKPKPPSDG